MASRVVYSHEFGREIDQGTLQPEAFDHYFLCEGDSWMDRSSPTQLSLPWALAKTFRGRNGDRALFINLSRFGDTLRHIGDCLNDDFHQWLTTPLGIRFDALLLSAAGNDFIDAALDPPPGQGILRDVSGAGPGLTADECFDAEAVSALVTHYLDPNFDKLYRTVRDSPLHGDMPILLNCYNAPVARHAPAMDGGKAWLSRAYEKNGIPTGLWPEVTERLFIDVEAAVTGWTKAGRDGLVVVPTSSVPLVPADPASNGSSGDWLNEIHPNKSGWAKLAAAWEGELDAVLA
jgi:hypothetical protein